MENTGSGFFKLFFSLIFLYSSVTGKTQQKVIDSLKKVVEVQKNDSTKVENLLSISRRMYTTVPLEGIENILQNIKIQNALQSARDALMLSVKINYRTGIGNAYQTIGSIYNWVKLYPEALTNIYKALKIFEELGNEGKMAICYSSISTVYKYQHNLPEALDNKLKEVKIWEHLKKQDQYVTALGYLGDIYFLMKNYDKSLEIANRFLHFMRQSKDQRNIAYGLMLVGGNYEAQGNVASAVGDRDVATARIIDAIENYSAALKILEKSPQAGLMAEIHSKFGNVFFIQKQYDSAKAHFQKSLDFALVSGWTPRIIMNNYRDLSFIDSV